MGISEIREVNEGTRDGIDYDPTTVRLTGVTRGENESVSDFQQRVMGIFFGDERALSRSEHIVNT